MSSSSCSRGLEQLVRAMNICTVGDLCSLSENQVQSLPIRSPKIPNIKNALRKFQNIQVIFITRLDFKLLIDPFLEICGDTLSLSIISWLKLGYKDDK